MSYATFVGQVQACVQRTWPAADGTYVLRCFCSVTPWHEVVDAVDFVVGGLCEHPGQPGLRVDVVEFGGFDQGIGDGCGSAATF